MKTATTAPTLLLAVGIDSPNVQQAITVLNNDGIIVSRTVPMTLRQWSCIDTPGNAQARAVRSMATTILGRPRRSTSAVAAIVMSEAAWLTDGQHSDCAPRRIIVDMADRRGIEPPVFLVAYDDGHIELVW